MRRREFIKGIAGSTAWPFVARAQQTGKVAKVGYLGPSSPALEHVQVDALKPRLHELGHVEGKDIAYVFRWAEGHDGCSRVCDRACRAQTRCDRDQGSPQLAAKRATSTIPIIFASSANPISSGLVAT